MSNCRACCPGEIGFTPMKLALHFIGQAFHRPGNNNKDGVLLSEAKNHVLRYLRFFSPELKLFKNKYQIFLKNIKLSMIVGISIKDPTSV
jgi:hypothetical protein